MKPKIAISSCLLGERVRYDGQHKKDRFLTDLLGPHVEWVSVCPEVEVGMGVPRETVRLVRRSNEVRLVAEKSGKDWSARMEAYSLRRISGLKEFGLSGYILKKDSPSCGMDKVRVYPPSGMPQRDGRGYFAGLLQSQWPELPVEEEGRLNDPHLRENFIERVFAFERWRTFAATRPNRGQLMAFHASQKFTLLSHSEKHLRRLGRLLADAAGPARQQGLTESYGRNLMEALTIPATRRTHTNVLQHLMGFVSDRVDAAERQEMTATIRDYHRGLVPLVVPITLLRHQVRRHNIVYLAGQVYLEPHPRELMLRNHV